MRVLAWVVSSGLFIADVYCVFSFFLFNFITLDYLKWWFWVSPGWFGFGWFSHFRFILGSFKMRVLVICGWFSCFAARMWRIGVDII